jgi:hypothetical protein
MWTFLEEYTRTAMLTILRDGQRLLRVYVSHLGDLRDREYADRETLDLEV